MDSYKVIPRSFFERSTIEISEELLGKLLVRRIGNTAIVGKIVETEAYLGSNDLAAHGAVGLTKRTKVLFERAGLAYVFRSRAYHCLNVVTEGEGNPSCVLLRAIEPLVGIEIMRRFRGEVGKEQLANGPGKLCQAFGVNLSQYGVDLTKPGSSLYLAFGSGELLEIEQSRRIGISKDAEKLYRFTVKGSRFLSR